MQLGCAVVQTVRSCSRLLEISETDVGWAASIIIIIIILFVQNSTSPLDSEACVSITFNLLRFSNRQPKIQLSQQ